MMIKEAFRNNKHFIVAKMQSRATDKFEISDKVFPHKYKLTEEQETLIN